MKLINIDTGIGRVITRADEQRIELAILNGILSIDLGEATDRDGDICLEDGDYESVVRVLLSRERANRK